MTSADVPAEIAEAVPGETRERLRLAIVQVLRELAAEGVPQEKITKRLTVPRVRDAARANQNQTSLVLRAYKAGRMPQLMLPWDRDVQQRAALVDEAAAQLEDMVRAAETDGDRERLLTEVAALAAMGRLEKQRADVLISAIKEARQAAAQKRKNEPPPEDPTTLLLASPEALQIARAFDFLVSDERRERVARMVELELAADLAEQPNSSGK